MSASPGNLDGVRRSCARVSSSSRFVDLDVEAVAGYAETLIAPLAELATARDQPGSALVTNDPWAVDRACAAHDLEGVTALVMALAAVNFGSGWHPVIRKRPGLSGATTMAMLLREEAERTWPLRPSRLAAFSTVEAHEVFDQPADDAAVAELMSHFATALCELGSYVADHHDGSFVDLVESASGSADVFVGTLGALPSFADVGFFKRAQLAAADLDRAWPSPPFHDIDRLTAFADNLVPHVLRVDGVLRYEPALAAAIDSHELLVAGSAEEVEIRANGVHAVELLVAEMGRRGVAARASDLDLLLWRRGGEPRYKAVPRHRARSVYY